MKLFSTVLPSVIAIVVFAMAAGFSGCGETSSTSECDCGICINDVPAYPCDSEQNCEDFAASQDCDSWRIVEDASDICGGNPQPVCEVSGCSGQCSCPGETGEVGIED